MQKRKRSESSGMVEIYTLVDEERLLLPVLPGWSRAAPQLQQLVAANHHKGK